MIRFSGVTNINDFVDFQYTGILFDKHSEHWNI